MNIYIKRVVFVIILIFLLISYYAGTLEHFGWFHRNGTQTLNNNKTTSTTFPSFENMMNNNTSNIEKQQTNNSSSNNETIIKTPDSVTQRFLHLCWNNSNKLKNYVQFHRNITKRKDFPNFLYDNNKENHQVIIYRSPRLNVTRYAPVSGIADRFAAMMTLFSICVATNTVCLVDWPELEWVLKPSEFFNSTLFVRTSSISRNFDETIDYMNPSFYFSNHFLHPFALNSQTLDPMLVSLKNATIGKPFGNVYVTHGYWGGIYDLIHVKKDQLYINEIVINGVIQPQHIYGCMFNLFFTLRIKPKR